MSVDRPGINVENLDKTLNALRVIDPEMKKNLNKEMVQSVRPILKKVKARVPTRPARNWGGWIDPDRGRDLGWDQNVVRRGITTSTANARLGQASGGVRSQFRILNKSVAGAIYETAGARGGNGSLQSKFFIRNLELQGKAPRLLIHTWREEKGYTVVAKAMRGVVAKAEARVNEALR
jgi:hypothetical protein